MAQRKFAPRPKLLVAIDNDQIRFPALKFRAPSDRQAALAGVQPDVPWLLARFVEHSKERFDQRRFAGAMRADNLSAPVRISQALEQRLEAVTTREKKWQCTGPRKASRKWIR